MDKHLLDLMKLQGEIRVLLMRYVGEDESLDLAAEILHKITTSDVASEQHQLVYKQYEAAAVQNDREHG